MSWKFGPQKCFQSLHTSVDQLWTNFYGLTSVDQLLWTNYGPTHLVHSRSVTLQWLQKHKAAISEFCNRYIGFKYLSINIFDQYSGFRKSEYQYLTGTFDSNI